MTKYVRIIVDKKNKTQRLCITGAYDCDATVNQKLAERKITFTNYKWLGRLWESKPLEEYKVKTYRYAKNYVWLSDVDVANKEEEQCIM